MMKKLVLTWWLVMCAGLAWAQAPVPLLWKVSSGANSMYLLGSFHLLKPTDYPLAPSVDAALADAQQLYFEVSPQEMESADLADKMNRTALRTDGRTLQQALPPKAWAGLRAYAAKAGMPLEPLQPFKPWFVALALTLAEFQKLGFSPALGLDQHLMQAAARSQKPAWGLETADAQIQMLDSMDAAIQGDFLAETLLDLQDMPGQTDTLHRAWREGDAKGLERESMADLRARFPALYTRLIVDRNRAWLPQLQDLLDGKKPGGRALVVVGALHLVGRDGVVRMLADKGYRVERLP